ncbi:MAG: hypothetical protein KatS3mg060_0306 [Dehalococcoidia bacterium]|nr:MAG: hypothetical protein KatS3mg060_0306 [Dehalococcoidia bacterium]
MQTPVGLLSREERARRIERATRGLYRWYVDRSQAKRAWRVDSSFDWRAIRTDHDPDILRLIEGYFAVEQYVPDYTAKGVLLLRESYGRSQFQIRWGAEEAKHADLWRNALLFAGRWSPDRVEQYAADLRSASWELPWDDPVHIVFYTVFQELATKLNYANLARLAAGSTPETARHHDPVLLAICRTIVADEAAHYAFYLDLARILLTYTPVEALEALEDVMREFAMPAQAIVPNWPEIQEAILRTGVYGPRTFFLDVLQVALGQLGVESRRALRDGIRRLRLVPDEDGNLRHTIAAEVLDVPQLDRDVRRALDRIRQHEEETGLALVDPTLPEPGPLHALIAEPPVKDLVAPNRP